MSALSDADNIIDAINKLAQVQEIDPEFLMSKLSQ